MYANGIGVVNVVSGIRIKGNIPEKALHSPSTMFPFGNPSTLSTTTFRGELDFIFTSDEAFVKKENAMMLKQNAMRLLLNSTKTMLCE